MSLSIVRKISLQNALRRPVMMRATRFMGTASEGTEGLRSKITIELKTAMKARDSARSTALRSLLSEVYAADKLPQNKDGVANSGVIAGIIRKAVERRLDAAEQFQSAARPELAAKEKQEAEVLQGLLPQQLSETEIDSIIREVVAEHKDVDVVTDPHAKRAQGIVMKWFYERVDKSRAEGQVLKKRVDVFFLEARAPPASTRHAGPEANS